MKKNVRLFLNPQFIAYQSSALTVHWQPTKGKTVQNGEPVLSEIHRNS